MTIKEVGNIDARSDSAEHFRLLWCRDTPRGCALLFESGLELEIFVSDYCSYARWWLADGTPIVNATWGQA